MWDHTYLKIPQYLGLSGPSAGFNTWLSNVPKEPPQKSLGHIGPNRWNLIVPVGLGRLPLPRLYIPFRGFALAAAVEGSK